MLDDVRRFTLKIKFMKHLKQQILISQCYTLKINLRDKTIIGK